MRASERASEGLRALVRGLRAPGRGEGACARGTGESATARIRAGCAPRAEVPSTSVLIEAWNTENNKELQLVLRSYTFPSLPGPAILLPLPTRCCHGPLSDLNAERFQALFLTAP